MGKKNYTNGVITKRFEEGDSIPDGWYRGVAPMSEEKKREVAERRKQTNLKKYGVENPSQAREIKDKKKNTLLEHYGVENPAQVDGALERAKQTCLERYGTENPSQSQEVKDKKKQTTLKNFGVEHPMQSSEVREKSKQSVLSKYGVEHISQSDEYKEKFRRTSLACYGTENPTQAQEVQDKMRSTCLERYGTEYAIQSKEVQEKIKQTCLERYGVESAFQSDDVRDKIRHTNLERYGVDNPFSSPEIQEKIRETHIKTLGVEYPMQSKEVRDKSIQTSLEKYGTEYPNQSEEVRRKILGATREHYGVDFPAQSDEIQERMKQTCLDRYGVEHSLQSKQVQEKIKQTCLEHYGVEWPCMRPEARAHSNDSGPNKEFASILDVLKISYEREYPVGKFSYDFRVGNTLIEIDPYATHNALWNPFGREGLDVGYHLQKTKTAEEAGFRCIHVFDWDNKDKIVSLLRDRELVYARKCRVLEVGEKDCLSMESVFHLQGPCRGQVVRLGLYYGDTLISLMTFGKPRYNKNYQYELLRYCTEMNVVGGAEKLFKSFVTEYGPDSIISYCDHSKFTGTVYLKLGFKLVSSGAPSLHWYNPKTKRHLTDNLVRQRGVDQLLGTSYGKGTSNKELLIQHDFVPIYDCGQDVYSWRKLL